MIDMHVHGHLSFDSDADYKDIVSSANKLGLSGICITEHLDLIPGKSEKIDFDIDKYFSELQDCRNYNTNSEFNIYAGIEIGLVEFMIDELNDVMSKYPFDSIIGSIHFVNDEDPYFPPYFYNKSKYKAYSMALEKYIELMPKYPNITVMGHFDYVARYSESYDDRNIKYKDFADYFDAIFKYIIQHDIALEINTSSYKQRGTKPINTLDTDILKRYKELGGQIITLASDGHRPEDLAYRFCEFKDIIKSCGFKYLAYYKNRKPKFYAI